MHRTTQPKLVDLYINHPDVRPTFEQGEHRLESDMIVTDLDNIVFVFDTGIIMFIHKALGVYEGHVAFTKEGRGAVALQAVREALEKLFTDYAAQKVVSDVPLQLPEARFLCRRLGFASLGADHDRGVEQFIKEA